MRGAAETRSTSNVKIKCPNTHSKQLNTYVWYVHVHVHMLAYLCIQICVREYNKKKYKITKQRKKVHSPVWVRASISVCVCVCVFVGASQCLTVCACVYVCEPAIRRLQLPPAQKSTGTAKGDITWLQQTTTQSTYSQSTTNVPQIYCFEQKFAN